MGWAKVHQHTTRLEEIYIERGRMLFVMDCGCWVWPNYGPHPKEAYEVGDQPIPPKWTFITYHSDSVDHWGFVDFTGMDGFVLKIPARKVDVIRDDSWPIKEVERIQGEWDFAGYYSAVNKDWD